MTTWAIAGGGRDANLQISNGARLRLDDYRASDRVAHVRDFGHVCDLRDVRHIGYVDPSKRRELYDGAALLVQPSFEEGFGIEIPDEDAEKILTVGKALDYIKEKS